MLSFFFITLIEFLVFEIN